MKRLIIACAGLFFSAGPAFGAPTVQWSFDQIPASATGSVRQGEGVIGSGTELFGNHRIPVEIGSTLHEATALSISAWVKPASFTRYNEIFRQECPQRILFSFQENGKILSFGLNINGYVECDAPIDSKQTLDGNWHHVAAVFDGHTMKVYLDGVLIGERQRKGQPAFRFDVPAFIGSSSGNSEFFLGGLDEVLLYREALAPEDVREQYRSGVECIAKRNDELTNLVSKFFRKEDTFGDTLTASRLHFREAKIPSSGDLAGPFNALVRAAFPEETRRFGRYLERTPFEFVASRDDGFFREASRKMVQQLNEYRPITEDQWAHQSPDQLAYWKEIDTLVQAVENDATSLDEIWMLGDRIQHRPAVHEAVAPYVKPETPPLRQLTSEEARTLIEADWLHQAGGKPTLQTLRAEIRYTRELAERTEFPGDLAFPEKFVDSSPDAIEKRYFEVRSLKRRIMLQNPVIDFSEILFVDMPFPQGKEWRHETRHRLGYMAVPGGRLMVASGLSPDGEIRQLMPQAPLHGSFWRPDISHDAKKVVFCFKPHNEKSFHLYEIGIDGKGLKQLTTGPYDDLDPIYLPGGKHILFSTTRGHTYVRCMPPTSAFVLGRCNREGDKVYLVSRNNEPDYLPSVLDDGRVIYTRWEYTDKPLWRAQGLWTMNPDGTQVNTLWGNQSVWPDLLKDARAIPNSSRIMFTGSAHHNWFAGSVGILDPAAGFNFPEGITKVTADVKWPESGNGPVDPVESPRYHSSGQYAAYYSPVPLSEEDFLVSANRNGKFVLYLMDVHGNRELLHEGAHHILHALPVRSRAQPPVIPNRVQWPGPGEKSADGVLYSNNIYEGVDASLRGKARYLRIMAIQPKTYTHWYKRPYLSTGPVVSAVQSDGVKEILGTVPIQPNGAIAFRAPSGKALHFQLLDDEYHALQTMRSFTGVMPGETRGCLGCHEKHHQAPRVTGNYHLETSNITPPPWPDRTVSWGRYVRPVLDRYCVECHQQDEKAKNAIDLVHKPGKLGFDENYWLFTGHPSWGKAYRTPENPSPGWGIAKMLMVEGYEKVDPKAYQTPPPMTALSYNSRLIELAGGDHYGAEVDPISLRRLKVWIDAMAPYRGEEEIREMPDPEFQGVEWLAVRPRIKTAPRIVRPGPVDGK